MATDKYRALALECDKLPDDGLASVLKGDVALSLGDTCRIIQGKIAFAPRNFTPSSIASLVPTLILYRKGNLTQRADLLEAADIGSGLSVGLVHYWSMNEASGTRFDPIGYITDLYQVGGTVGSAAGLSGLAAYSNTTTVRLEGDALNNPGPAWTLALAMKSVPAETTYSGGLWGSLVFGLGSSVYIDLWDEQTGDDSVAVSSATNQYDKWCYMVGRFNNAAKTFTLRHYGLSSGNKTNFAGATSSGSGWVNTINNIFPSALVAQAGIGSKGYAEEFKMWSRLISDGECDYLAAQLGF